MSKPRPVRAFVAVLLPGQLQDRIIEVARPLERLRTHVCLHKKENLHVTLKFMGDTPAGKLNEIGSLLQSVAIRHAPFDMEVAGLGAFPGVRSARVVWAGVAQGARELKLVSRDVETSLVRAGFEDENCFKAHITLARIRKPEETGALEAELNVGAGVIGRCRVEAIHLMKSTLSPAGSSYEALQTYKLGG